MLARKRLFVDPIAWTPISLGSCSCWLIATMPATLPTAQLLPSPLYEQASYCVGVSWRHWNPSLHFLHGNFSSKLESSDSMDLIEARSLPPFEFIGTPPKNSRGYSECWFSGREVLGLVCYHQIHWSYPCPQSCHPEKCTDWPKVTQHESGEHRIPRENGAPSVKIW